MNKTTCLSRRSFAKSALLGVSGYAVSPWIRALADETATDPKRRHSCILLWMTGGPSQLDTFDPKPGHANGGPVKSIDTSVPGIQISEYLPKLAQQMQHMAIVRSMSTKEGDHTRGTYHLRTGYRQQAPINYPPLGASIAKELTAEEATLPGFVSVAPYRQFNPLAFGPGFLGSRHAPLVVGETARNSSAYREGMLKVTNLSLPERVDARQAAARQSLLAQLEDEFVQSRPDAPPASHQSSYENAIRMMQSDTAKVFDLDTEPDELRDAYGRTQFGQGCLLARRLVEQGVPFVEVSLNGVAGTRSFSWDTHQGNFRDVPRLCEVLDPAWSTLLEDLNTRGLLDSTLVVWMGEFGRTPQINRNAGRDHFPAAWSTVLCGGGIQRGMVYGDTGPDGVRIAENPTSVPDLLATICQAIGVDPQTQNISNVGRPINIVEPDGKPIAELLS